MNNIRSPVYNKVVPGEAGPDAWRLKRPRVLFYSGGKRMPEETMIEMYKILSRFTVEERDRIVEIVRLLTLPCTPE